MLSHSDTGWSVTLTSDKDVGGVGLVPGLGCDAQGVEPLVLLVEVGEGQRGLVSAPVHLVPFGRRQQHVCGANGRIGKPGLREGNLEKPQGRETKSVSPSLYHCTSGW